MSVWYVLCYVQRMMLMLLLWGWGCAVEVEVLRSCLPERPAESGAQPESRRGLVLVDLEGFAALLARWLIDIGEFQALF